MLTIICEGIDSLLSISVQSGSTVPPLTFSNRRYESVILFREEIASERKASNGSNGSVELLVVGRSVVVVNIGLEDKLDVEKEETRGVSDEDDNVDVCIGSNNNVVGDVECGIVDAVSLNVEPVDMEE
jgi:hypothetical protein